MLGLAESGIEQLRAVQEQAIAVGSAALSQ
jgi:hypothetical protein